MKNSKYTVSIVIIVMDYQIQYFEKLIATIELQSLEGIEVVLIDKTAGAVTNEMVPAGTKVHYQVIEYPDPAGFAQNNNVGIGMCDGEFIFVLNLDTILEPNCLQELVMAMDVDSRVGCVSPKILRLDERQNIREPKVFDSVGMYITKFLRHKDRGTGEVDQGQYNEKCYVFGVTGAGAFFRKTCLEEIKINEQYLDEDFWSYREDADVSWRLGNYGWRCLYMPEAVMYHVRTLRPGGRSVNSELSNMHSVKNRYLLMINNMSLRNYLRYSPFILARDFVVVAGVILLEHRSFKAFVILFKNIKLLSAKRRLIQEKAKTDVSRLWFHKVKIDVDEWGR